MKTNTIFFTPIFITLSVLILALISLFLVTCNSTESKAFELPKTGQDKCYNMDGAEIECPSEGKDLYGQDANYQAGKFRSYTKLDAVGNVLPDNATEWIIVKDNVTNLIWEVKTEDGGKHDSNNQYTWFDPNPETNGGDAGTESNGTDTQDFIQSLNDSSFGGYSDWRLPTIKELLSLVHAGKYNPAINTDYFSYTQSGSYWTSSCAYSTDNTWSVDFYRGLVGSDNKSLAFYVRAVRLEQ